MAEKKWYVSKVRYCEHVGHEIELWRPKLYFLRSICLNSNHVSSPTVVPMQWNAMQINKPACAWCGTNPDYRPL